MPSLKDKLTDWMAQRRIRDCDHRNVSQSGQFCPDCGHKIFIEWAFLRCAQCNVKRPPFRQPGVYNYRSTAIRPMQKFCKHCGATEFTMLKKQRIDAYELLFAVPIKHLDPEGDRKSATPSSPSGDLFTPIPLPEPATGGTFSHTSRPQLKTSPFSWQPNRQNTPPAGTTRPVQPFNPPMR